MFSRSNKLQGRPYNSDDGEEIFLKVIYNILGFYGQYKGHIKQDISQGQTVIDVAHIS